MAATAAGGRWKRVAGQDGGEAVIGRIQAAAASWKCCAMIGKVKMVLRGGSYSSDREKLWFALLLLSSRVRFSSSLGWL